MYVCVSLIAGPQNTLPITIVDTQLGVPEPQYYQAVPPAPRPERPCPGRFDAGRARTSPAPSQPHVAPGSQQACPVPEKPHSLFVSGFFRLQCWGRKSYMQVSSETIFFKTTTLAWPTLYSRPRHKARNLSMLKGQTLGQIVGIMQTMASAIPAKCLN